MKLTVMGFIADASLGPALYNYAGRCSTVSMRGTLFFAAHQLPSPTNKGFGQFSFREGM
jgi:hypothetical protein